jgi:hypothetical protein
MTSVITIYGKPFSIGFGEIDDARRRGYFKGSGGNLTPQEKSLLLSIGIDVILENSLKPYLADFFSSLQTCSSDTNLILSKDCETAYFVLWSALFHNRAETTRRMAVDSGGVIDDLDLAQDSALITGLKPKPKKVIKEIDDSDINALFSLVIVPSVEAATPVDEIDSLFTLMLIPDSV